MIDLSQAASIAVISLPLAAIVITVVKVRGMGHSARQPGLYSGDKQPAQQLQCQGHCQDHGSLLETFKAYGEKIDDLKVGQKESRAELLKKSDDLWDEVKTIQGDVKTMLRQKAGGG